jgi:DNA polymerase III subunit beta
MKFRIERDALAEAVAWSARSLPSRPAAPVLAGLLLEVTDDQLAISGFDYEVSTQAQLEVNSGSPGRALVSGRLLADIAKALPAHPVEFVADGSRVSITCGSSKFTLPTMPDSDYPRLPELPSTAGTVSSSVFARAVSQVAIAAGRDDTLPMLTGVRLEIDGERLTLAATDRYRLAVRELTWNPASSAAAEAQVLVPARTLHEAARSLTGEAELTISLSMSGSGGEGIIGFSGTGRRTTTRLLDAQFPPYRSLLPQEFAVTAEVPVNALSEAVKRVALVAERGNPVRLQFAEGTLTLTAGGDDEGRAEENLEAEFTGEGITTAFNPAFLLEGLGAIEEPVARLLFTTPTKPAVLRPAGGASDYTYLIMPVRLPG